nr:amidohydrolase family protein [Acidocella sp.]
MDILDAQVHVGRGKIATTLAAMDALGIRSVIIDELWELRMGAHPTHIQPGHVLPNGSWRTAYPTAVEAALSHPERFAFLVRIDPRDPQLESVMRTVGSTPGALAFRLQPVWTLEDAEGFAKGSYEPLLEIAQDIGLPVCLFLPGYAEALPRYLKKFPRQMFIVDHCGMGMAQFPAGRDEAQARRVSEPGYFDHVLALAEFPNVALKLSHAQSHFGTPDYPYAGLRPYWRRAIAAFGAERLIWASDNTVIPHHSWADMLYYLRDDPEFSGEEKAWMLGRAARKIFNWPAA